MTPRIITYFLCGMRHPTTGLSEDDLSRLTGSSSSASTASADSSSSSTSSSSSSSSSSSPASSPTAANSGERKEDGSILDGIITHSSSHKPLSLGVDNLANNISINHNNNNNNNNNNHTQHNSHNSSNNSHTGSNNSSQAQQTEIHFKSTYLPEFINPLEWQKSRKRKERLDSSSSSTQDRKLQRSNSEETVPTTLSSKQQTQQQTLEPSADNAQKGSSVNATASDVIRRVSSEDFKRTSYAAYEQELKREAEEAANTAQDKQQQPAQTSAANSSTDENDGSLANKRAHQQDAPWFSGSFARDMTRRTRYETSPARSQRHSPQRQNGAAAKHRDSDDSECENERRRSSERFSKARAPPGRKAAGVSKKTVGGVSGSAVKYLPAAKRGEENVYKYDISALKYERRGFISKKNANAMSAQLSSSSSDHNDNNLIDLHQQQPTSKHYASSPSSEDSNTLTSTPHSTAASQKHSYALAKLPMTTSAQEALPWERSAFVDEPAPVLSRRYAAAVRHHRPADGCGDFDTAAKLSKVMPYPQHFHKSNLVAQRLASDDDLDSLQPLTAFRAFTSLENLRTREVMQQIIPAIMSFQSPEERLKQVNKRLTAMKKKLAQLEEAYETRMGYRPSQGDRLNDKYMKNVLAEISKLRKERHELKSDPMGALGLKVSGGMDAALKLEKMRETLAEIEQSLSHKRQDANRSEVLDELTPDQLVQEKTAVQHCLLYFESQYGRPTSKDERDVARTLYDRYRQLKRMVSRNVLLVGGSAAGAPELPTILEHEAMVFESTPLQYSSANSTETTNSPSGDSNPLGLVSTASNESNATANTNNTTTTAGQSPCSTATPHSDANENISALNIDQLWELLERTREDKKLLKRSIREYETIFEEQNGRKMLKNDRKSIEETYAQYKEKKAKTRLLQALIKKHISR